MPLSSVPYPKLEKKKQQQQQQQQKEEETAPSSTSSNPVLELELTEEKLPMTLSRQEVRVNSSSFRFAPRHMLWCGVLTACNSRAGDPASEGARGAGASVRRDRLRRLPEAPQDRDPRTGSEQGKTSHVLTWSASHRHSVGPDSVCVVNEWLCFRVWGTIWRLLWIKSISSIWMRS